MHTTLIALYITVCSALFIISKMLISFLCYKKWARKKRIIETSLTGNESFSLGMEFPPQTTSPMARYLGISPNESMDRHSMFLCVGGKMVIFRSAAMQSLSPKSFLRMIMGLSSKDIIGSGGYGTVYMLRLDEKSAFAIKKLSRGSAEMDRGFERELDTMGDIKHRNIVPLCGYYAAPHFNLLIYELMPNGSLDAILHAGKDQDQQEAEKKKRAVKLDWPVRYKIALGVARGLAYLHHDCIPHVIHRDIKSSNILLDHNMEARVSDFGLATLMKPNESHVTTVVAGTFGYLAPGPDSGRRNLLLLSLRSLLCLLRMLLPDSVFAAEYFETGRATTKGDVYSYGVVLLELLTGKRPTDESFLENGTRLVTWVSMHIHLTNTKAPDS